MFESAQIILVEYTNNRLYLGVLHEDLTFCKTAIAKTIGDMIKMNLFQNALKVNPKDIKVIDKKYIVFCNLANYLHTESCTHRLMKRLLIVE